MDSFNELIQTVSKLPAMNPAELAHYLAPKLHCANSNIKKFYVIFKVAERQHALLSPYACADIRFGGVPKLNGQEVLPYNYLRLLRGTNLDRECVGWLVNFAVYNGEVFLHYVWWGFELSKAGADDYDDTLMPFRLRDEGWTYKDMAGSIRDVYIMLRNLLLYGLSAEYLEMKLVEGMNAVKSCFASWNIQQTPNVLPIQAAVLVAREDVVERVLNMGAFEAMDEDCLVAATRVQNYIMRETKTPIDCCSCA